jgi:quercetin dioxygenase-like cupin family protein
MKIVHTEDLPRDVVREPGAKRVLIRRLIDTPDGADRFVMSMFDLSPDGMTPPHFHDWEHEIYVLSGSLRVHLPNDDREVPMRQGDAAFIPRGEPHALITGPDESAQLLLVAPAERPPVRSVFLSDEPYEHEVDTATRTPGEASTRASQP